MIIWLKKNDGSCARLADNWKPRIHVCGETRDLLNLACKPYVSNARFVEKFEKAGDREKSRTLEIEVSDDREAGSLARRIQKLGTYSRFRLYDIDIPAVQMYLYKKSLFPLAFVQAEETDGRVYWSLKDSRESVDYQLPRLRIIGLKLETRSERSLRSFRDELDRIRLVEDGEAYTIDSGDELEKILRLVKAFREMNPDIVLTEGGDSFIFPFLARKAQELGILEKLVLGREESPLRVYDVQGHSYFSYGKILYRDTAARLLGRLHIDEKNAFITSDCDLEGLFEVSRTCIIPVQRASRATIGTSMTSLQLYNAVTQNVLIPWNKNEAEEWKGEKELVVADRGGFVYEPATGLHEDVGELDFSSLYPTVMLKHNLSGETVKCNCCPESTSRVPDLGYHICQRWQGIVPRTLDILLRKRAVFKRLKKNLEYSPERKIFDKRQAALKWILVCCLPYDSPVLISQDGKISYQQIGRVIDQQLGDAVGVLDCPQELFVSGVDRDLKSKFCRVSKLIKTLSPKTLLHVKMEDGRQVKCTSNHSFYVLRNGSLVEVNAADLSKGDLVPVAKRIVQNNTIISNLDLLQQVGQQIDQTENDLWRAKSDSLRPAANSSSSTLEVVLKKERRQIENLSVKLLDSDVGFVAIKEVEQIEPSSPFVYCFEISGEENFPAFFTGSGGVLVHNSFGYLGFKNARFGKIDAHIATCAFARTVLNRAKEIAMSRGFSLVHGIVDSMWLRKPGASGEEYEGLCGEMRDRLCLPISFEGRYRWIVFLGSRVDNRVPVLNRYFGVFQDGTVKVRGIELRRHDTPGIVEKCQRRMLAVLGKAGSSSEFKALVPQALRVLEEYVSLVRTGRGQMEDLVIRKNLNKMPGEYRNLVPQAVAARHLEREGGEVHAGQSISYVLTKEWRGDSGTRALPVELAGRNVEVDREKYVDLLVSSARNLLEPLGYNRELLRTGLVLS